MTTVPLPRFRFPVVVAAVLSSGCYTLHPVVVVPTASDTPLAFDITDAGRVALGNTLGPPVRRLEGRLVEATPAQYTVAVSSVDFLAGGSQTWTGEPVQLNREFVALTYRRQLSKGRTLALAALTAGAAAFIVSRSLNGGGDPENRLGPRDSIGTTSRGRRP